MSDLDKEKRIVEATKEASGIATPGAGRRAWGVLKWLVGIVLAGLFYGIVRAIIKALF